MRGLCACLVLAALAPACADHARRTPAPSAAPTRAPMPVPTAAATAAAPAADLFTTSVLPILKARCSPCHFPGGALYERLPFDRPETLASHRPGALRRLKGDDRAAFEEWLRTLP